MANFGLKFRLLISNNNCCKQKDSSSKIATKVYTARWVQAQKKRTPRQILRTEEIFA